MNEDFEKNCGGGHKKTIFLESWDYFEDEKFWDSFDSMKTCM